MPRLRDDFDMIPRDDFVVVMGLLVESDIVVVGLPDGDVGPPDECRNGNVGIPVGEDDFIVVIGFLVESNIVVVGVPDVDVGLPDEWRNGSNV